MAETGGAFLSHEELEAHFDHIWKSESCDLVHCVTMYSVPFHFMKSQKIAARESESMWDELSKAAALDCVRGKS